MTTPVVIELRRNGNYVARPGSGGQTTPATADLREVNSGSRAHSSGAATSVGRARV
jgi:hypothetical protein